MHHLYLSLLCFTVDNPKQQMDMARTMAIFNWAIWKGRHWSISHGKPLIDFVDRMLELCSTYTNPHVPLAVLPHLTHAPKLITQAHKRKYLNTNNGPQLAALHRKPSDSRGRVSPPPPSLPNRVLTAHNGAPHPASLGLFTSLPAPTPLDTG